MPLHVARLRDSDLAAECDPEACWYAVLLWCASWHQLPAGSLPNNDKVLCKLIGLGRDLKSWTKNREQSLRGWYECSDGRLYHPTVAGEVIKAWRGRLEQMWRTECARIKKHNERNSLDNPKPTLEEFLTSRAPASKQALAQGTLDLVPGDKSERPQRHDEMSPATKPDVPSETPSKGERQGERERQGQGYIYDDDDAGAGAPPAPTPPPPPDPFGDIGTLTSRCGRAAGVALMPNRRNFADQLDIVRSWIDLGLDPDTEIIPTLEQAAVDDDTTRHSLKYFSPMMAKLAARKEASANGKTRNGSGKGNGTTDGFTNAIREARRNREARNGQ